MLPLEKCDTSRYLLWAESDSGKITCDVFFKYCHFNNLLLSIFPISKIVDLATFPVNLWPWLLQIIKKWTAKPVTLQSISRPWQFPGFLICLFVGSKGPENGFRPVPNWSYVHTKEVVFRSWSQGERMPFQLGDCRALEEDVLPRLHFKATLLQLKL